MKVLLTGSAGFIGYHTARKLLDMGEEVVGIDNFNNYYDPSIKRARTEILKKNKKFHLVEGNIIDGELVKKTIISHGVTQICHLAAQAGVRHSLTHPFDYEDSNVKGFLVILEAARHAHVKQLVYASSASVYGNSPLSKSGFSEKDRADQPLSLYGATKRANELMAFSYHHLYSLQVTGLRFFSVYGPWGRPDMALYKFTEAILNDRSIDVYNFGKMKRNFTFIDDIVSGVISALQRPFAYEIFNLGNNQTVDLNTFINLIEKELGKKALINFLPMQAGDVPEALADISHAQEKLDFMPVTDVEEGIRLFVEWYKSYHSRGN